MPIAALFDPGVFARPVIILSAPRSGSDLLFRILSNSKSFWTIGGESHVVIESVPSLRVFESGTDSNRLTGAQADPAVTGEVLRRFAELLRDRDGRHFMAKRPATVRLLEKTPKNSLRVPFLNAVFPDALYIYLYRDARENISSIMEAWRSGDRFVSYRQLRGWDGDWCLLLPPGWRELRGKPLEQVAAFQWAAANSYILDDLPDIPAQRWTTLSYADLIREPRAQIKRLCRFADVPFDPRLEKLTSKELPLSPTTVTAPLPDKWKKNEKEILSILPLIEPVIKRIERTVTEHEQIRTAAPPADVVATASDAIPKPASVGRNDPCPCGSGRKYKHCHGATSPD